MADSEKVIRDAEKAIEILSNVDEPTPWCDFVRVSVERALELLRDQEPRVLTLEEAKKAEVCWLEQRGYEPYATDDADTWNPEVYGKVYRCWSLMPTDEQRKAIKWDD